VHGADFTVAFFLDADSSRITSETQFLENDFFSTDFERIITAVRFVEDYFVLPTCRQNDINGTLYVDIFRLFKKGFYENGFSSAFLGESLRFALNMTK
jgi:hypothetical protein